MSNATTLVVTAVPDPNELSSVQTYLQGVMPLLTGAGGKLVKRLEVDRVVNGKPSKMALVMDFASSDEITAMFESDEYAALLPARDRGFTEMNILLTHSM